MTKKPSFKSSSSSTTLDPTIRSASFQPWNVAAPDAALDTFWQPQ